jgi:hypothetical protein
MASRKKNGKKKRENSLVIACDTTPDIAVSSVLVTHPHLLWPIPYAFAFPPFFLA